MNRHLSFVLMAGFLFAIPNPAMADPTAAQQEEIDRRAAMKVPETSWYVAGGLGASLAHDVDATQGGLSTTAEFDTGAIASMAFGYLYGGGLRAEGEFSYLRNDVSSLSQPGLSAPASGNVSTAAFMVNGYFELYSDSRWKPFIGVGLGYSHVFIDVSAPGFTSVDDSVGVFAYQFKVGTGFEFTDSVDGTFGYRLFGTANRSFKDVTGAQFSADGLQNHILELGVRYRF